MGCHCLAVASTAVFGGGLGQAPWSEGLLVFQTWPATSRDASCRYSGASKFGDAPSLPDCERDMSFVEVVYKVG